MFLALEVSFHHFNASLLNKGFIFCLNNLTDPKLLNGSVYEADKATYMRALETEWENVLIPFCHLQCVYSFSLFHKDKKKN